MKRSTIQLAFLGISIGAGVWLVDTIIDAYVFHEGTFWQVLTLTISPEDAYDRIPAVAGILLFTLLAAIANHRWRQLQDALEDTRELNRDLVAKAIAAVLKLDPEGIIVDANIATVYLSGYSREELVSMPAQNLFPHDAWETSPLRAENLHKKKIAASDHLMRRRDGSTVPVAIRPSLEKTGNVEALIEDITERAQANAALLASETKYRQLMEQAPNGIFVARTDGKILEVNRRACELLGYTREEFAEITISSFMPDEDLKSLLLNLERLGAGVTASSEGQMIRKDGSTFPVEISSRMIGENVFQSIVHDITERHDAEKNLRASKDRFRRLFDSTPSAILIVDTSESIIETNRTVKEMFGYNPEELVGRPLNVLLPEEYHATHSRYFEAFVRNPTTRPMGESPKQLWGQRRDGSSFPVDISLSHSSTNGDFLAFAVIHDDTARYDHEKAVQASEEQFRSIFEEAPIGISLADAQGRLVSLNPALAAMLGYEQQELIGTSFLEFTHPDDRNREDDDWAALREGRIATYSLDKRYVRKDGEIIWVHLSISRFPGEFSEGPITMALIEDITERKKAEEALQRANRAYRMISDCNQALVRAVDEQELLNEICGIIVQVGGYQLAWVGVPAEDHSGKILPVAWAGADHGSDSVSPDRTEANSLAQTAMQTGETTIAHGGMQQRSTSKGRPVTVELPASAVALPLRLGEQRYGVVEILSADVEEFDDSEVLLLAELASDIAFGMAAMRLQTFRRQAERHLMESEALFRAFFDNTAVGTAILSPDGRFVEINGAVSQMFGYGPRELIGKHFSICKADGKFDRMEQAFEHLMRGEWLDDVFEEPCVRKNGERLWVRAAVSTIKTPRGDVQYVTAIAQDITEAKQAEQELARLAAELDQRVKDRTAELQAAYEQLQALGEVKDAFVSNVSHELRTPITSLKLNQALLEKRPEDSEIYLGRITRETRRLEVIIEDLLTLSRLEQGRVDFLPTTTDVNAFLRNLIADRSVVAEAQNIQMTCDLDPTLPPISIDSSLIGQAVSVLLTNAINYTPAGGNVTVSTTQRQDADLPEISITVRDDGPGIQPEEISRLFSRFYRGEAGSKLGVPGTGLGLSIAYEIVSRHRGRIEVYSEGIPGKGSTFTIWLPATQES